MSSDYHREQKGAIRAGFVLTLFAMTAGACLSTEALKPAPVTLGAVTFAPNPNMVTAAIASFQCRGAIA